MYRASRTRAERLAAAVMLAAAAAVCVSAARGVTERDLCRALEQRGIAVDAAAVSDAAVAGILKGLDPRARVISAAEAKALAARRDAVRPVSLDDRFGYLKVRGVFEGSGREIAAWLERCAQAPGTGGILDLRGADGDDLDALREVAARLAPAGSDVFEVRGANGRPLAALRTPTNAVPLDGLTLVVLADGETGGASEALAALLKGRAGVLVAGTPTRGDKGLMEYIPLSDTEVLYVATRWLFTPEGRPVSGVAVTPDVPVRAPRDGANVARLPLLEELLDGKPVSERAQRDRGLMERVAGDAVLERAVDMLLGLEALDLDTAAREPR